MLQADEYDDPIALPSEHVNIYLDNLTFFSMWYIFQKQNNFIHNLFLDFFLKAICLQEIIIFLEGSSSVSSAIFTIKFSS